VDGGRRHLVGWGKHFGRLVGSLRSAGLHRRKKVDLVFGQRTSIPITFGRASRTAGRKAASFPNADVYVAKAESDFLVLSPEIAAKAPKDAAAVLPECAKPSQRRTSRPVNGTRSVGSEPIVDQHAKSSRCLGHTPGHTGYEFSSKGQKNSVLRRHHPCTSESNCSIPRSTAIFRHRPDCGCRDAESIAV